MSNTTVSSNTNVKKYIFSMYTQLFTRPQTAPHTLRRITQFPVTKRPPSRPPSTTPSVPAQFQRPTTGSFIEKIVVDPVLISEGFRARRGEYRGPEEEEVEQHALDYRRMALTCRSLGALGNRWGRGVVGEKGVVEDRTEALVNSAKFSFFSCFSDFQSSIVKRSLGFKVFEKGEVLYSRGS